jgi:hypothetical protein
MRSVEVVLRYFHRYCPRAAHCGLLLEGLRSLKLTAMDEAHGDEDLCGSGRRSITTYVHRDDCCIIVCSSN